MGVFKDMNKLLQMKAAMAWKRLQRPRSGFGMGMGWA